MSGEVLVQKLDVLKDNVHKMTIAINGDNVEVVLENSTCKGSIKVLKEVYEFREEGVALRRWFHANPELSFQEVKTAAKVVEVLKGYGITEIFEGCGKTGVVALIRGGAGAGPCIGLRADMDALPITETADIPWKSTNEGVMHACGHDGHMAGLLMTAKVLQAERAHLRGVVKLLFQPAEEGYGGAKEMINDGVLEDGRFGPRVDSIYGIHLWSVLDLGNVLATEGAIMAASDKFEISVGGSGGHGAAPHETVDAIVEAASLINSLQTIVSRNVDPLEASVLTCGTIQGGYGYNIIADKVKITGTVRTMTRKVQERVKTRMCEVCSATAAMFGGKIDMDYSYGYPPTVNAYPECVEIVKRAAAKFVGDGRSGGNIRTMGAEDFSYFLQERSGCFFFVGAQLPGDKKPHHKSNFDFDESALLLSSSVYVQIIRDLLLHA